MKIDKNNLVDLLVDKTNMEKAEVEAQLDQLIDRIIDAANRGKALEIKDFGLFYFDDNEELKFEPAKELSTEISFKYAGMKPVELHPERDTGMPLVDEYKDDIPDEDEAEEEDIFGVDLDDEDDLFDKKSAEQSQDEEDVFGEDEGDDLDDFDFLSELPEETEDAGGTSGKQDGAKETLVASKMNLNRQPIRKKNNAGLWVLAAIVLIIAAGGLFYFFTEMQSQPGTEQTSQFTEPSETETAPEATPEDVDAITDEQLEIAIPELAETEEPQEQEPVNEVITQPEPVNVQPPGEQPVYGLTGIVNEEANDGYSIVVHSFNDEINARQAAERLGDEGFRVLVSSRTVANNTMWRVSVGQFASLEDAQAAVSRLPNSYSTQNFIHRIQIN